LQRLADPIPGTPRHNPGTPNLGWSRTRHSFDKMCSAEMLNATTQNGVTKNAPVAKARTAPIFY